MTAYLTEFIVGLLAMASLFVCVGKNDPMVNDVTIGKQFTNGDIATKKDRISATYTHRFCRGQLNAALNENPARGRVYGVDYAVR